MDDLRRKLEYYFMQSLVPVVRDWLDRRFLNEWYINGSLHVFKDNRHFVLSVSEVKDEK